MSMSNYSSSGSIAQVWRAASAQRGENKHNNEMATEKVKKKVVFKILKRKKTMTSIVAATIN